MKISKAARCFLALVMSVFWCASPIEAAETSRITFDCQRVGGEQKFCLLSEENLRTLLSNNKRLQARVDEIDESDRCKLSKTSRQL